MPTLSSLPKLNLKCQDDQQDDQGDVKNYPRLRKAMNFIIQTRANFWQAALAILLIVGVFSFMIIQSPSETKPTVAGITTPALVATACVANPPGGSFSTQTNIKITCGVKVKSASYTWQGEPSIKLPSPISLQAVTIYQAVKDQSLTISGYYYVLYFIKKSFTVTYNFKAIIVSNGQLKVSISENTPATGLILPSNMKTITVFKLEALHEDITLDAVKVEYLDDNNARVSSNDLARIYLVDSAGAIYGNTDGYSVSATSTLIQNLSSAANKFIVPSGGSKDLYIKADINPISVVSTIATSGNQLGYKIANSTINTDSYLVGKSSASSTIVADLGTGADAPTGNPLYLRKGLPIITFYGANPSGSFSGTGSQLVSPYGEIKTAYYFKVVADSAGGNIGLYNVVFSVATTTASATNFYWYDTTIDSGAKLDDKPAIETNTDEIGAVSKRFYIDRSWDSSENIAREITASVPHTFKLVMTTKQDDAATDDFISVTPLGDYNQSQKPDTGFYSPTNVSNLINNQAKTKATANFVWSDGSVDAGYATSSNQWYNGYKVPGIDATNTGYQVIFVD